MPDPSAENNFAIDPIGLRRAFGTFVTGVTVITTHDSEGRPRGMTANSFTSVSLDPPLLLICVGKSASSYEAFASATCFAVNLLHEGQKDVSGLFASKSADKFATVSHDRVHTGAPVLSDCLTWFDCAVHNVMDAGDHVILIGKVQAFGTSTSAPLGFCRGQYAAVKSPLPAGWTASHEMIVGYLIEANGKLLLCKDGKGGWTLPIAQKRISDGRLPMSSDRWLPLLPEDTFLYSVFDVADGDPGHLIYRARLALDAADCDLTEDFRFFPMDDLPCDDVPARQIRSMLQRYVRESAAGRFGIYMDSHNGGRVAMVDEAQWWGRPQKLEAGE